MNVLILTMHVNPSIGKMQMVPTGMLRSANVGQFTGVAEEVYKWSASRVDPGLLCNSRPGLVRAKGTAARGVWGMLPPGNI